MGRGHHPLRRRLDRRSPAGRRDASPSGPVLHAPGEGRGSDRRGLFRAWREDLQPRHARRARQDRPRHRQDGVARPTSTCWSASASAPITPSSAWPPSSAPSLRLKSLLFAARQAADALGICFHVGSQAMSPAAFAEAMARVRDAIVEASVTVDIVDVGGGFPSVYPGMEPPPLENYFAVIHAGFEALPISYSAELWCEPGRALCAEYGSLVVRVEKRRGTSCTSTTAPMGRCSTPPTSAGAIRCGCCATRRRRSDRWNSASTARPATISTIWRGRSSFPPTSAPAIISKSACSAPTAARCGPASTASEVDAEIVDDEPMASLYAARKGALERRQAVTHARLPAQAGIPMIFL